MKPLPYDPDKIDWIKTYERLPPDQGNLKGPPKILVFQDGTEMDTTTNQPPQSPVSPPASSEVSEHLNKRRPGRPPGVATAARTTPLPATSAKVNPLPAGSVDGGETPSEKNEEQELPMPKPRTQTLPGTTASAGPQILRELPLEQIHEAAEQNLYEQGVEVRIHYKNARGTPSYLGIALVQLEQLSELEPWLRDNFGGGCFRIDARDPATKKRALPIPVFEVTVHAPPRLTSSGTVLPPGASPGPQFAPSVQGSPPMSGFQGPWMQPAAPGLAPPFIPGNQPGQGGWFQHAAPAQQYGQPGVHQVPVMSMPPDAIAMTELGKAQHALERERSAHARQMAEMSKKLETLSEALAEQRLKEEDRARLLDQQQMREQMRRMEENFKAALDQERNRRPAFDLSAVVGMITAVVPIVTAMINSRGDQATKSLEVQSNGIQSLMKATLDRADNKWLEKLLGALPVVLPAVSPMLKLWAEQKSPAAQADLVATLSENHLTALGMMAKFMNEMASSGPDQPAWLPVFQQMSSTILSSIDAMVKSNKASVGLPVTSKHMPAPAPVQVTQPAPMMTPAQIASGMPATVQPGQTVVTPAPAQASSIGAQIRFMVFSSPQVPADLKSERFLGIVEDLHNRKPAEEVAAAFADLMRDLGDKVPEVFKDMWTTDDPEALFSSVFVNLPIWDWDNAYAKAFVAKAVDILTTDASPAPVPANVEFFQPPTAAQPVMA